MVKCEHCGKETKSPFKCKYCFGYFCEDCYLPQNHDFPNIDGWKKKKPPSGMDWSKITNKKWKHEKKEKPPEVIAEEEKQLTEEEKEAYLSLRRHFCYACGKPLADHPIGICSACNLSFCPDHIRDHDCVGYDRIKVLPLGINYEDIYNICLFCGKRGTTYKCSNCCGGRFCREHKYPDDHRCRNRYGKSMILDAGVITYLPPPKGKPKDCLADKPPEQPTSPIPLDIININPSSPVSNFEGESREFTIEFSQKVDIVWYLNDKEVQTDTSVKKASYTVDQAKPGNWDVTAYGENQSGANYHVWQWNVKPSTTKDEGDDLEDYPVSRPAKSKSNRGKVIAALVVLFVIVGVLGAYELGYIPLKEPEKPSLIASQTPTATSTPSPTPNLVDELTVSMGGYRYIGTHDFSGITVDLRFKNSNEVPVRLTVIEGQTASGLNLLDSDRKTKEPLDEFELNAGERFSREYFIPELRLSEVTGDRITMTVKVSTEEVSQTKTMETSFD